MPTISEAMTNLLKRGGVDTEQEAIKTILSAEQLSQVQLPENVYEQLNQSLLTTEQARNNPDLFNHFKAVHLNGVDASFEELIKDIQDETIRTELKALPTSKKAKRMMEVFRKMADEKALNLSKDKDGILGELDKIRTESLTKDERHKEEIAILLSEKESELTEAMQDSYLGSIKYGNELPTDVNKITANVLIKREMEEKGIGYRRKGMTFELFNKAIPDIPYTENNLPVKYEDFVTRVLAKNKMLEVTKPADPAGQRQPMYQQPSDGKPVNYNAVSQVSKIKQEMAANGSN